MTYIGSSSGLMPYVGVMPDVGLMPDLQSTSIRSTAFRVTFNGLHISAAHHVGNGHHGHAVRSNPDDRE